MKKSIIFMAGAALMLAACSQNQKPTTQNLELIVNQKLEQAKNFEDTVIAIDGSFMGAYFNYNLHTSPELNRNLDMAEVERGMRQAMSSDTTAMSYLYGLQVGLSIMNTYRDLGELMPINKDKLFEAVMYTFRLDTIDREQLLQLRERFEQMDYELQDRREEVRKKQAFESREATENRMLADAVAAKLQSSPDYTLIAGTGIYEKVITPGTGSLLQQNERVRVSYTITSLDGKEIESINDRAMMVSHAANPMLKAVLPLMHRSETAEFFVPYSLGYGETGSQQAHIGPCESLMLTVTTAD